jgi:hypothetical protein
MLRFETAATVFLAAFLGVSTAAAQNTKKTVFLAAKKDHGMPGRHEYEKETSEC